MPETGYSLVAGLTWGNAKRRDSLRFHPYGFTVGWHPRQLLGFSAAKTRAFGCNEKLRGSVAFAPGITDLDNVIFHAERIAATCWFRRWRGPCHDHGAPDDRTTAEQILETEIKKAPAVVRQNRSASGLQIKRIVEGMLKKGLYRPKSPNLRKAEGRGSAQWQ